MEAGIELNMLLGLSVKVQVTVTIVESLRDLGRLIQMSSTMYLYVYHILNKMHFMPYLICLSYSSIRVTLVIIPDLTLGSYP